jgi:uncharacterized protein
LLIFDEIQICPRAITSLKYFSEDAREYYIAAAGSMLGVEEHKGSGWPVGKIDKLLLYPMSFSEFMVASKNELMLEPLKNYDKAIIKTFMDKYTELLKNYYFAGSNNNVPATHYQHWNIQLINRICVNTFFINGYIADTFIGHYFSHRIP